MSTMYCNLCKRPVEAKRHVGVGTLILAVITAGVWLLAIPFYSKRCGICNSDAVSDSEPSGSGEGGVTKRKHTNWVFVLAALVAIGIVGNMLPSGGREPSSTNAMAASRPAPVGVCVSHPLDLFPVGEVIESDTLSRLIDASCPNARFHNDGRTEVSYGSQTFYLQTKKLNYEGPAMYEIVSIAAAGT